MTATSQLKPSENRITWKRERQYSPVESCETPMAAKARMAVSVQAQLLPRLQRTGHRPEERKGKHQSGNRHQGIGDNLGHPYKYVAQRLGMRRSTVAAHLRRIYEKLSVQSRGELTRLITPLS